MKRFALWAATAVTAICAPAAFGAPTIGLVSGVPQTFTMPAGAFTTSFFVDVGADATQLKIDLTSTGGQDLDLLLRYGSPFPDTVESGLPPSASYLTELSQYYAQSSESSESLVIGQTNVEPVRAGRWYITVLNFGAQTNATLQATTSNSAVGGVPIEVVTNDTSGGCNVAAWSDPTTRAEQTGNNGTTLGQLRVNAIQRAAQLLAAEIKSPVPIRVQACWDNLGTGNSITLAQAGPTFGVRNSSALVPFQGSEFLQHNPFLPRNYTTYSIAPATKLAGTRACGILGGPCDDVYDIRAEFNDQVDTGSALGNRGFWYGFATQLPANDVDFIATAMHEITHGLGFAGAINKEIATGPIGAKYEGHDDIFDANVAWVQGTAAPFTVLPLMAGTDADRAAAMVSSQGLRWTDPAATNSTANPYRQLGPPPENFVRLHAPTTLQPGSTLSHLANASSENSLMLAQVIAAPRKLGLAAPMMGPLGWSEAITTPPVRAVRPTQYFDPAHVGHGINFGRVSGTFHYLIFYTYGADGSPEYYISTGQLVDGVYTPAPNANGDSLLRIRYNAANSPPQSHDPGINGRVRLDFNGAEFAPACQDGRARDKSSPLAVMSWTLGNDRNIQWCMQALLPESLRPAQDYTGAYFASAADQGWGFDMLSFPGAGGAQGLGALIYYPDAQGFGRWAYMQEAAFQSGRTYTLYERRGYCRTCPVPASAAAGQFDDVPAGTIAFTLNGTGQASTLNNRVTFSVELQRPGGGRFQRTNSPLQLISEPVP